MRVVILLLLTVLLALQYRLWFGKNSLPDYWRLQQEVKNQQATNDSLKRRNQVLYADIEDLREGEDALEERARNELVLVYPNCLHCTGDAGGTLVHQKT